jgi:nucleoside-diphosphate-sugar epimerase
MDPLVVSRSGRRSIPDDLDVIVCDVADQPGSAWLFADAGLIINCAAPGYSRWPLEFPALQAGLLQAARRSGAVLVDAQNTYMYGHTSAPFNEDQPVRPISRKGEVRARLADELMTAHARGDIRVAIGRIVSLYGPYQTEGRLGTRVFGAAVAGTKSKVLGDVDLAHSASFVSDVAAGLVTLGIHESGWGRIWHLPAPPPLTTREFLACVYEKAGHPTRFLNPPGVVVRLAGKVVPAARELAEMLYLVEEATVIDDRLFRETFRPQVTCHDEGIERTVEWFRTADVPKP